MVNCSIRIMAQKIPGNEWLSCSKIALLIIQLPKYLLCIQFLSSKIADRLTDHHCIECHTFNPEKFGDGTPQAGLYILCPSCQKWCHWGCSCLAVEATETEKDDWKCTICASAGSSKSKSQRPKRSSKK